MLESVNDRLQNSEGTAGESLSLAETMRIMDVAGALRQQRERAEQEFAVDEVRLHLRRQLLETARVTGDCVTEHEVDAAIEHYFENLHTFHEPPGSVSVFFARLYIRRWALFLIASAVVAVGLLAAWIGLR